MASKPPSNAWDRTATGLMSLGGLMILLPILLVLLLIFAAVVMAAFSTGAGGVIGVLAFFAIVGGVVHRARHPKPRR